MDPLAEDFYSYSPYNYVGNNPIRRIDPNGNDWRDIVKGAVNAIVDNNTGGLINRRETTAYSSGSDYNLGQDIGDAISLIASSFETLSGGLEATGGAVVSVGSGGTLAIVGAPVAAAGVAQVAHGTLTMSKAVDNLTNQKGRVFDGEKSTESRSSREAHRNAKDQNGVPRSQQPDKTIKPNTPEGNMAGLDNRNVKRYEYTNSKGEKVVVRQDKPAKYGQGGKGDQGPHYNAGKNPRQPKDLDQHHNYPQ